MQRALLLAERAAAAGEVPVGALVTRGDEVIGEGWNCPIGRRDPSAHAEIVALRAAARAAANYRLPGCTLYVTLEPCTMCVGALLHARIARLVFGALEPKAGAVASQLQLLAHSHFNHRVNWQGGVLAEPCGELVSAFFRARRAAQSAARGQSC